MIPNSGSEVNIIVVVRFDWRKYFERKIMSEGLGAESVSVGGTGEGLQVGVLDAVLVTGLVVVVVALVVRYRRRKLEEQSNLRSLKVITK